MLGLDQEVFLIFARGQVNGKSVECFSCLLDLFPVSLIKTVFVLFVLGAVLNKHSHKSQSTSKVDVCKLNTALQSKTGDTKLLKAHGNEC